MATKYGKEGINTRGRNTENASRILGALDNRKYKARTLEGIAKEIGFTRKDVVHEIKNNPSLRKQVKVYRRKSSDGRLLVTTQARYSKEADLKDKFIDTFSSRKVGIDDV